MNLWGLAWGDSWGTSWGPLHEVEEKPWEYYGSGRRRQFDDATEDDILRLVNERWDFADKRPPQAASEPAPDSPKPAETALLQDAEAVPGGDFSALGAMPPVGFARAQSPPVLSLVRSEDGQPAKTVDLARVDEALLVLFMEA